MLTSIHVKRYLPAGTLLSPDRIQAMHLRETEEFRNESEFNVQISTAGRARHVRYRIAGRDFCAGCTPSNYRRPEPGSRGHL